MIKNVQEIKDMKFGGKAFGLNKLISLGVKVPSAFAINQNFIDKLLSEDKESIYKLKEILNSFNHNTKFAVRSSASNEDGTKKSFAGMYDSELNVLNNYEDILLAITKVNNSKKSNRLETYDQDDSKMNIVLQEMIDPKVAGVCFTDAINLDGSNAIYIEYVEGLGEGLVSGKKTAKTIIVNPTDYTFKSEEDTGNTFNDLLDSLKMITAQTNEKLDIEWCIDNNNIAYFVQARPITKNILIREKLSNGAIASPGYCKGKVYKIDDDAEDEEIEEKIANFPEGAVLVAKITDTNYVPAMKKASGIITTEGSVLSHAAIVAREFGIPCITGFKTAFEKFDENKEIILDTNENKLIYDGDKIDFGNGKEINLLELYNFDNIIEENIDDKMVLVEEKENEFGIHIDEELSQDEIDLIDIEIRKKYKKDPTILKDQKYLWYTEYERFKNFPKFDYYCNQARNICKDFDTSELIELVDEIIKDMKNVHESAHTDFEKALSCEYAQATHFIINLFICNGCAMESINNYIEKNNIKSIKEVLNENTKQKEFLSNVEKIRESIWGLYVRNEWSSDEYFDNREDILSKALGKKSNNIVDDFYMEISTKFNKKKEIVNKNVL